MLTRANFCNSCSFVGKFVGQIQSLATYDVSNCSRGLPTFCRFDHSTVRSASPGQEHPHSTSGLRGSPCNLRRQVRWDSLRAFVCSFFKFHLGHKLVNSCAANTQDFCGSHLVTPDSL